VCVSVEWSGSLVSTLLSVFSATRDRKRNKNAYEVENESRIIDQVEDNRA
jgi:hypothetical protein